MGTFVNKRIGAFLPTDEGNRVAKEDHAFRAPRRKFLGPERGIPVVTKPKLSVLVRRVGLAGISGQQAFLLVMAFRVGPGSKRTQPALRWSAIRVFLWIGTVTRRALE